MWGGQLCPITIRIKATVIGVYRVFLSGNGRRGQFDGLRWLVIRFFQGPRKSTLPIIYLQSDAPPIVQDIFLKSGKNGWAGNARFLLSISDSCTFENIHTFISISLCVYLTGLFHFVIDPKNKNLLIPIAGDGPGRCSDSDSLPVDRRPRRILTGAGPSPP